MFNPQKFKGARACVFGLGKSGIAAALLLKRQGFEVILCDDSQKPALPAALKNFKFEYASTAARVFDCAFMVKSPGIPRGHNLIRLFKKRGGQVFSEIEIARAFAPENIKIFAITGTNGKTTTTELLARVLREHAKLEGKGRKVYALGNVGRPFAAAADKMPRGSLVVLEVSSYQLEDSTYFRPDVSAILNIAPDHLEHHGSMAAYAAAKCRVFREQGPRQAFVTNGDDSTCVKALKKAKCRVYTFATTPKHSVRADVFYDGDEFIFACGRRLRPPRNMAGMHNMENAMAAALMAFAAGVGVKAVQKGFDNFKGLEHRIEFFAEHKGVKCYNDSKGTNVDSTVIALKALQSGNKIWLILGGREKGFPYNPLFPLLRKHCKEAVLIGEGAVNIGRALEGVCKTAQKGDIKNAVHYIFANAAEGDIMLLSPACASFDQFAGYEDRGCKFKQAVMDYIAGH
ncbi:MAG: UDP-N-acetylmuramoyl-L-alanine--D-glutamate ligase [Elusimicrobiota bacterium]|jgi:UDP-N-acetylmuramoylalanine--D-glutamate ligase|nr:UDP-N-acetylmuramoyl-L-alanine--D-glutamate ligase [Elusimicrobiota bacterium]